jgi:hypothetical protein
MGGIRIGRLVRWAEFGQMNLAVHGNSHDRTYGHFRAYLSAGQFFLVSMRQTSRLHSGSLLNCFQIASKWPSDRHAVLNALRAIQGDKKAI